MATVALHNVTKAYGDVVAVSDLSLAIEHGEFLALLGPSGCGKTTTLQMLAGFVEATSGDIRIDGKPMRGIPPHKRNIGVVFQSYALFPHLTVFDNVAFGLKMRDVERGQIAERVKRALDLVQLTSLDRRYPKELSGGQQQRVALARALVIEPSVLLLDEPLSNLDANLREQMRFEIREIQKRIGITTVFVTHDQNEAMAAADRLVVMSKGEIRQIGTAREIYETPTDLFVAGFIGQANLLHGKVTAVRAAEADIALENGGTVTARHDGNAKIGDSRSLALRPEDLELAAEEAGDMNSVRGTVVRVNYLGASINAGVRAGDADLIVSIPRGRGAVREGEQVFVRWPKSAGIMLSGNGG
jgi:putative spermidine/putrescine transport system ATP-binding protein